MTTAPPVSAEALNIYIIFVQMTDRARKSEMLFVLLQITC